MAYAINFKENYPELTPFRQAVIKVIGEGIARKKDPAEWKEWATNLYESEKHA